MDPYIDGIVLLEFSRSIGPHIIKSSPNDLNIGKSQPIIEICGFPENNSQNDIIFSITTASHLDFVWYFSLHNQLYSIVIINNLIFASPYLDFLKSIKDNSEELNEIQRFEKVVDLLSRWTINNHVVHIQNFNSDNFLKINSQVTFSAFSPDKYLLKFLDVDKFYELWHALFTNSGILVVGDDQETLTYVSFSIFSLISPYIYSEQMLISTRLGDPRFADVISGKNDYPFVATTNRLVLQRCKQFKVVIDLGSTPLSSFSNKSNNFYKKMLEHASKRVSHIFDKIISSMYENDPFFNILNIPLERKVIDFFFNTFEDDEKFNQKLTLTTDEAMKFCQTRTFFRWKSDQECNDIRTHILSISPDVALRNRSEEQLEKIRKELLRLQESFKDDYHMNHVLNCYFQLIEEQIGPVPQSK